MLQLCYSSTWNHLPKPNRIYLLFPKSFCLSKLCQRYYSSLEYSFLFVAMVSVLSFLQILVSPWSLFWLLQSLVGIIVLEFRSTTIGNIHLALGSCYIVLLLPTSPECPISLAKSWAPWGWRCLLCLFVTHHLPPRMCSPIGLILWFWSHISVTMQLFFLNLGYFYMNICPENPKIKNTLNE